MSVSCRGVLMENLEACMQQGVSTSPIILEAFINVDLSIVEGFATTPLIPIILWLIL